jgi:hypothetical protein
MQHGCSAAVCQRGGLDMDNRYAEWMMNLDAVVEYSIGEASGSEPLFVLECGKKVTARAEAYVRKAIQAGMNKPLTDEKIESFIENEIGELLDCIDDVNHVYFKNGMKLGASLILQLLGAFGSSP